MSEENKNINEDGVIEVNETAQSVSNVSRASRLASAIKQVQREESKGQFNEKRK